MKKRYTSKQHGLTFIELLTVLAMIGIVASIAMPSFNELMQRNRQYAEVNNFLSGLAAARSEAIKQGLRTVICTSSNGTSCDNTVDWDAGWIIFTDEDADNTPDSPDEYVLIGPSLDNGYTIVGSTNISNVVRYEPSGNTLETGFFTICDPRGADEALGVIISAAGSPKKSEVDTSGNTLTCP